MTIRQQNIGGNMNNQDNPVTIYLKAGYPFLYLCAAEEVKAQALVLDAVKSTSIQRVYGWDMQCGLQCLYGEDRFLKTRPREKIGETICYIEEYKGGKAVFIFKDLPLLLRNDPELVRRIKNLIRKIVSGLKAQLVLISSAILIPPDLEKETAVIDVPYPSKTEIANKFDIFCKDVKAVPSKLLRSRFIEALNGLTDLEIENLLSYCISDDEKFDEDDIETVILHKQQIIRKSRVLEFVADRVNIAALGGMEGLKSWLKKRKTIFDKLEAAQNQGVDMPKGVLLFGMPGCGKSLAAKVIAGYFEMPLLRMDMGMILGMYVGQSEENIRKAIKMAEAIAPSVLWIDELEKAFSGAGGGGSDVTTRVFGSIITWMQEKKKPVFVVAMANNIDGMPPEFMRKGRFDEIFFVDFPGAVEAQKIFEVHLKKRDKQNKNWVESVDCRKVGELASKKEFSGADIEAVVKEVVEDAFVEEKELVTTAEITKKIEEFSPLSKTMKPQIDALKEKVKELDCKKAN